MPAYRPGPRNLITDIAGLTVGHATDERVRSGVTAVLLGEGWSAAVDVRGGGPGTRETDVLTPGNLVGMAHAIVLAGGSVFGLGAADGVAAALSARGRGLALRPGSPAIPIVPTAVLHDLGNGGDKDWQLEPPYRGLGLLAVDAAQTDFAQGRVGAGRGAMAGFDPGGIGSCSIDLDGYLVGALVALNAVGSVYMPDRRTFWAWPFELDDEFGGGGAPRERMDLSDPAPDQTRLSQLGRLSAGANTVLGVVACNARLDNAECRRIAVMAQDGIARAVRPAHTPFDGDTVFAVASGENELPRDWTRASSVARLGAAAADCVARALARAAWLSRHHGDAP